MFRKITEIIQNHLKSNPHEVLVIDGARQVGKSYIIREIGEKIFRNYTVPRVTVVFELAQVALAFEQKNYTKQLFHSKIKLWV